MWPRKRDDDVEMEEMRGQRTEKEIEETQYRPVNWKKIFLSPKYIRKEPQAIERDPTADGQNSMAYSFHRDWYRNSFYNDTSR